MVDTFFDTKAAWLAGDGPLSDTVICSFCKLSRNFSDFPFSSKCSNSDKLLAEKRILELICDGVLFNGWQYFSLPEMSKDEILYLLELHLIGRELVNAEGPRGVLINEDLSISISVNGNDHICIRGLASGFQLSQIWSSISLIDDKLTNLLDFSYDERLGYLSSSFNEVGTALKAGAVIHLPALSLTNELDEVKRSCSKRYSIFPLFDNLSVGLATMHVYSNIATLGRSEEEILFHLKQFISESIEKEEKALQRFKSDAPKHIEDDVGRALGLARGAHLMAFNEAIFILSSIRTGIKLGIVDGYSVGRLNELLISLQNAHLRLKVDKECNERALNIERASLVRAFFN